ncbi:MAG: Nif3-like dinuclear metal center hexameric protein [Planctomycetes bacterium]|nr:Nif3-like dinuclear metal center hexameric protein [Planctomycetota bacterium]MCB9890915.1 Nif3-like dinuclear metal center hexameric protein [Planctomycetota bacterium]
MDTQALLDWLHDLAPLDVAESWDNVGLLVGRRTGSVERVMTCLTLTPDVVLEALDRRADLVVTHHPMLFRATKRITDESAEGRMLLDLVAGDVRVYSPHTSWDSAREGINRQLAEALALREIVPMRPLAEDSERGSGRIGSLPEKVPLHVLLERVKRALHVEVVPHVGEADHLIGRMGIACGAADDFVRDALRLECDALLLGEARFHTCLEARTAGMALILPGHYATERPAMGSLATRMAKTFPELDVWASTAERDPVRFG